MTTQLRAVPERRRVIDLEDARNWLNAAIAAVEKGDTAQALYGTHQAIRFATEARDLLVELLVWQDEPDEEATS